MAKKIRSGVWMCTNGFHAATKAGAVRVGTGQLVPRDLPYTVLDDGRDVHFVNVEAADDDEDKVLRRGPDEAVLECDECDYVAKSPAGLSAHRRSHDG